MKFGVIFNVFMINHRFILFRNSYQFSLEHSKLSGFIRVIILLPNFIQFLQDIRIDFTQFPPFQHHSFDAFPKQRILR